MRPGWQDCLSALSTHCGNERSRLYRHKPVCSGSDTGPGKCFWIWRISGHAQRYLYRSCNPDRHNKSALGGCQHAIHKRHLFPSDKSAKQHVDHFAVGAGIFISSHLVYPAKDTHNILNLAESWACRRRRRVKPITGNIFTSVTCILFFPVTTMFFHGNKSL